MNENKINEGKAIVLNRMYVGDYLDSNLGHEVINLFKADNNQHYIYLNATGNFAKEHQGEMGYMLFVKYYNKGLVEVIGMATGLKDVPGASKQLNRDRKFDGIDENIFNEQKRYIEQTEEGIFYNGVSILDIFNDAEQQSIFVTYKAEKVYRIKRSDSEENQIRRFIRFSNAERRDDENDNNLSNPNARVIELEGYNQAKASLKQYIYPSTQSDDHGKLIELMGEDIWEEVTTVKETLEKERWSYGRNESLFDICQIQNNENAYSCALAHFMKQPKYAELWKEFFSKELNIELDKLDVNREESVSKSESQKGRIDLVIRDSKNIVVIENKILSDINKVATDQNNSTQLRRYYDYVQFLIKEETVNKEGGKEKGPDYGKTPHFFILCPEYNQPTIEEEKDKEGNLLTPQMSDIYTQFTYAKVYNFLKEHLFSFYNDANFVAFFEAMERHTHKNVNDYLYFDMLEKFIRRIKM